MATLHYTKVIDDLDGESVADGTVDFSVGDTRYQIDLSSKNAQAFEKDLDRWIKAARKVGKATGAKKATKSHHAPAVKIDDSQAAQIRQWAQGRDQDELRKLARSTGLEVADRGRLSIVTLTAAYNVANPTKRTKDTSSAPVDIVDRTFSHA